MIIKKVVLKNFLSHSDSTIQFNPDGITAIIGENGSGKSSIIEAIQFGLFGESEKGKLHQLIKWGKKEAVVELEFENSLGLFRIHREIVKNGKEANTQNSIVEKFENNRFRPYYQKNLKNEVPKLIGFTKKTFLTSGLIKQGDIEGLLSEKPSQREMIIDELLGIQYYQKVIEKYKDQKKSIKNRVDFLIENKPDTSYIRRQIAQKESELSEVNKKKEEVFSKLSQARLKLTELEKDLELAKEIERKLEYYKKLEENISEDIKKLDQKLAEIEELKKHLPAVEKKYQKYKKLIQDIQKAQELENLLIKKNNLLKYLEDIEEDIRFVDTFKDTAERIEESRNKLKILEERLEKIRITINEVEKKEIEKKNLEKDLSQKRDDLAFLNSFEEKAIQYQEKHRYLKQLSEDLNQLSKKKGQVQQLQESIKSIDDEMNQRKNRMIEIADNLKDNLYKKFQTLKLNPLMIDEYINQNTVKIEELTKQKEELQRRLGNIESEGRLTKQRVENLSSIGAVCPTCNRPIEQHEKQELIDEINQTLENLRKAHKQTKEELRKVDEEIEKQNQIKVQLTEFKNLFSVYKEREAEKTKLINTLVQLQQEVEKLENIQEEKQKVEDFIQAYNADYGRYISLKNKGIHEDIAKIEQSLQQIQKFLDENNIENLKIEKRNLEEEISRLRQFISDNEANYARYSSIDKDRLLRERQNIQSQVEEINRSINHISASIEDLNSLERQQTSFRRDSSSMYFLSFKTLESKMSEIYMDQLTEKKIIQFKEMKKQELETLEKYNNLYHEITQKLKEEESLKQEIEQIKQNFNDMQQEKEKLQNQLSQLDLQSKLSEKEAINQQIDGLLSEKDMLISEVARIETELKNLKDEYENAKKNEEEIKQLNDKLQKYEKVIQTLSHIGKLVKDNALYMLPKITEEIFSRFNFVGFSGLKFDEKYSIELPVNYPGVNVNATVDSLSGGQRIALALALRFAISYLLNTKLDFLILDEPTIHMDRHRRRELVEIIGDLKEKRFVKQLIVVTHDEEIEERADTIYKVSAGQVELV